MRIDTLASVAATLVLWVSLASAWAGNEFTGVTPPTSRDPGVIHSGLDRHSEGRWYRGEHDGRYGWWWVVGRDWFAAKRPARLAPELYVPHGEAKGWWYLCPDNSAYYPFVTRCLAKWVRVQPH